MSKTTLILCDDDREVLEALGFLLRQAGYEVLAFSGGQEVLDALSTMPQPVRAIFVLDLDMPPMDGDELHERLLAQGYGKRNPVIFLSGKGTIARAVAAKNRGALDFVEKPYTNGTLLPMLESAVALEAKWHKEANRKDFLVSMWTALTPQQKRVALRVRQGLSNKSISTEMGIGERMVEVHISRACEALGVDNAKGLAATVAEMETLGIAKEDAN